MCVNKAKGIISVGKGSNEKVFFFDDVFKEGYMDDSENDDEVDTLRHIMKVLYSNSIEVNSVGHDFSCTFSSEKWF